MIEPAPDEVRAAAPSPPKTPDLPLEDPVNALVSAPPAPAKGARPFADVTPTLVRELERCPLRAALGRERAAPSPAGLAELADERREVGRLVHACLAAAGRRRLPGRELPAFHRPTAPELVTLLEQVGGPPAALRRAAELLEALAAELDLSRLIAVEEPWQLEIGRDPDTGRPVVAGGRFERVDQLRDGTIRLVDVRTGKRALSRAELLTESALGLHLAAARARWPFAPRIEALVWWIERDVRVSVPWTEREDWFARVRARAAYHALRRDERSARVGEHCASCPFAGRCEAYAERQRALAAAAPSAPRAEEDPAVLLAERRRLQEVAQLARTGKAELDRALRARLERGEEVRGGGLRAKVITRRKAEWSPGVIPVLARALGRDPAELLTEVGRVCPEKLEALLRRSPPEATRIAEEHQSRDAIVYLEVRECAPF